MVDKRIVLISLNDSVGIEKGNFAEISLFGKDFTSNMYEVQLKISKEALIGFATHAIRMSNRYDRLNKYHIHVDPLGNPSGNQAFGFFLTNKSPSLVVSFNDLLNCDKYDGLLKKHNINKLDIKTKMKLEYQLELDPPETALETHEIGFTNIAEISILDANKNDVTDKCLNVVFKITERGLLGLGHEFLRLAQIFRIGQSYQVSHINTTDHEYDLGFHLLQNSCKLTVVCEKFENAFYYEPTFGII